MTRIADSGLGANVTRYVAVLRQTDVPYKPWRIFCAAMLMGSLPVAGLCLAMIWPVLWYAQEEFALSVPEADITMMVLCAVTFGILNSIGMLALAVAEGAGLLAFKNRAIVIGNLAGLLVATPAIRLWGGPGLGITYVLMGATLVLVSFHVLFRAGPSNSEFEKQSGKSPSGIVSALRADNTKLLAVAALRLSFEPLTKSLLSVVGGLAAVASFELALRLTTQVRVLLQAGSQPLLELGAREGNQVSISTLRQFGRADRFVRGVALLMCAMQLTASAFLSFVGFGKIDRVFLVFFAILVIANTVNALGLVGYFLRLSSGDYVSLVRIHVYMSLVNVALGLMAYVADQELFVVAAYGVTLAVGGVLLSKAMRDSLGLSWRDYAMSGEASVTTIVVMTIGVVGWSAYLFGDYDDSPEWLVILTSALLTSFPAAAIVRFAKRQLRQV